MDLVTRILVVDDDEGIRTVIASFLEKNGLRTSVAGNPAEMRDALEREHYDLIVLDVMMPREDGLTALRRLKAERNVPVIMLSAVGSDIDRIVGLELGADDYLAKPCNPRELLARIRTVLRASERATGSKERPRTMLRFAGWAVDLDGYLLFDPTGQPVTLSDGEFRLLRAFVQHPKRILTRDQLLDLARGPRAESYDRAIDVQISRLRRKLEEGSAGRELIRTVRNEGYLFNASVSQD